MSSADRAVQFMPFASLRGYYDLVRECEIPEQTKKVLSTCEQARLNYKLCQVKKGMLAEVKYYNRVAYDTVVGTVTEIEPTFKYLRILNIVIPFDDILEISADGISDEK